MGSTTRLWRIGIVIVLCIAGAAFAQDKKDESKQKSETAATPQKAPAVPSPSFGGVLFANYAYVINGTDGADFNRFDMERMYLTMKMTVADDWKLQMTTDIYRNSAAGTYYGGLSVRLKFGFLDYGGVNSLSVKFGMIPTAWNSTEETLWKYRGLDKTVSDKYGYFSTSDLGVSATYALPDKIGEVAAYMVNGDNFQNPETNRFKDYTIRASLTPFKSIEALKTFAINGLASVGNAGTSRALDRNRYGVLVGYSWSVVSAGFEVMQRMDAPSHPDTLRTGNAMSAVLEVKSPFGDLEKLSLVARYDGNEPNVDKGGDMTHLLIVGLAWKASDKVTLVLDHQEVYAESTTLKRVDGVWLKSDRRWFVHAIVSF